jgi:hypothetical protein
MCHAICRNTGYRDQGKHSNDFYKPKPIVCSRFSENALHVETKDEAALLYV